MLIRTVGHTQEGEAWTQGVSIRRCLYRPTYQPIIRPKIPLRVTSAEVTSLRCSLTVSEDLVPLNEWDTAEGN
jgi:hypothetical protein